MSTLRASLDWTSATFLVATIALPACANVTTSHPLGETALPVIAEEWEGTWLSAQGDVAILKVVDESTGSCELYWLEDDTDPPEVHRFPVYIRESRGWTFASAPEDPRETTSSVEYVWARIRKDGEIITLWTPRVERFKELVEEGSLPGQVNLGDVHLGALESQHYELIVSEDKGLVLDWENPGVLRRIKH
jgi:hypothetical protein